MPPTPATESPRVPNFDAVTNPLLICTVNNQIHATKFSPECDVHSCREQSYKTCTQLQKDSARLTAGTISGAHSATISERIELADMSYCISPKWFNSAEKRDYETLS